MRSGLAVLTLLFFFARETWSAAQAVDPCSNYNVIDDVHRSSAYTIGKNEQGICDIDRAPGWYRFNSSAGGTMAEHPIGRFHCGTVVPIWMNGTQPSAHDGMVQRQMCANLGYLSNFCERSFKTAVKNCTSFVVYYLLPTPSCPMAYCAGHLKACSSGKWSPSGLEPNCKDGFPKMTNTPTLQGPEIVGKSFVFYCTVNFNSTDPNQEFEVAWTFDGKEDTNVPRETLSDPRRTATLQGFRLKGHMGTDVGCKVRSSYRNGPNITSPWLDSNIYRVQILVEPGHLDISENGAEHNVTITSTVPIVCDHNFTTACFLTVQLDTDGPQNNVLSAQPCNYKLMASDWNSHTRTVSTTVTVAGTKDKIDDGDKKMILKFQTLEGLGSGPYVDIFTGYQLQPIQLTVRDLKTFQCNMVSDPHIHGFSNYYFHLFEVGTFTIYENQDDLFEVEIRTFSCNTNAACICGVAIREKDDVILIDGCHKTLSTPLLSVAKQPLREGTVIERSTDGKHTVVQLPSGREVQVITPGSFFGTHRVYSNVLLVVPGADIGHGRGMCGTITKHSGIENRYRSGELQPTNDSIPTQFELSWRKNNSESLFNKQPLASTNASENHYCQCDTSVKGSPRINCTVAADNALLKCPGRCLSATRASIPFITPWTGKREILYEDLDVPDPISEIPEERVERAAHSLSWPTPSGITENEAMSRCVREMQKSQLWAKCNKLSSIVQINRQSCVTDIQYGDNFDMLEAVLVSFTSECQAELGMDPSSYVTNDEGKLVMKPEMTTDLCSVFCMRNGRCVKGQCVCNPGFAGDNCQLDATKGPQLIRIRGSNYCDVNERPCRKIYFDATNFQMGGGLVCKIQEVLPNGQRSSNVHLKSAVFLNSDRLICPLPDSEVTTDRSVKTWEMSVANDNSLYGNTMRVTVYDSTCRNCNNNTGCIYTLKANTCLIDDLCYKADEVKPDDVSRMCKPSLTSHNWTRVSVCDGSVLGDEWTVFQQRMSGSVDFYRTMAEYEDGFGNNEEFWIGLRRLHSLTSGGGNFELRVDLQGWHGSVGHATYSNFSITDASDNYRLKYLAFTGGNAGDSLGDHRDSPFTTKDSDHDALDVANCAVVFHGGWWYNHCCESNLNGAYFNRTSNPMNGHKDGIAWLAFRGYGYSLKCTEMKFRSI